MSANDAMVSVRLPRSLVTALKAVAAQNHYLDQSEAIRSILRQKMAESSNPVAHELRELRSSIHDELKRGIARKSEERLMQEMKKIREKIRDELRD